MMILLYNLQVEHSLYAGMRITSLSLLLINRYFDCIKRNAVT